MAVRPRKLLLYGLALSTLLPLLILLFLSESVQEDPPPPRGPHESKSLLDKRAAVTSRNEGHMLKVQEDRRRRWKEWCGRQQQGHVDRFWVDAHHGIAYCPVPKIGCTFWVNVFRFFANDTGRVGVASPFEISRVHTHYGSYHRLGIFDFDFKGRQLLQNKTLRFMFARDPYSRLWSAYVDKFFLPDFWGWQEAKNIILRRNKSSLSKGVLQRKLNCPDDITFPEFISFLTARRPEEFNNHWRPAKYLCDPCIFRPHILGKMETFGADSRFILDLAGEGWILASSSHKAHVTRELGMLVDYNFWILRERIPRGCLSESGLAERLWTAFVHNGYISPSRELSPAQLRNVTQESFKGLAVRAYNEDAASPEEERRRRHFALRSAFTSIERSDLLKLVDIYQDDFDLFGYSPFPISLVEGGGE